MNQPKERQSYTRIHPLAHPNYQGYFSALDSRFASDREKGASIQFGPRFHVATSGGQALSIDYIVATRQVNGEKLNHYYLLAYDEGSDNLVGHVMGEILIPQDLSKRRMFNSVIKVNSEETITSSAVRGVGIGSTLELVHEFVLQDLANTIERGISYVPLNGNRLTLFAEGLLDRMKTAQGKLSEPDAIKRAGQRESEQKAWDHIWHRRGILGIKGQKRVFKPSGKPINSSAKDIWLQRQAKGANKTDTLVITKID